MTRLFHPALQSRSKHIFRLSNDTLVFVVGIGVKKGKQVAPAMVEIHRSKRFISSFMCFCSCQADGNVERSSIFFVDVC